MNKNEGHTPRDARRPLWPRDLLLVLRRARLEETDGGTLCLVFLPACKLSSVVK